MLDPDRAIAFTHESDGQPPRGGGTPAATCIEGRPRAAPPFWTAREKFCEYFPAIQQTKGAAYTRCLANTLEESRSPPLCCGC